jgi:poly(hydroxyalkanoate) granule-associated protein
MSNDKPKITVTRGKRTERSNRRKTSSAANRSSSGLGLPGPADVVTGVIRGARSAWWAGLGVFAVARDVGSKVFEALVEEGKSWEQVQRKRREETVQRVQTLAEESDAVEAVEERIRNEVNAALRRVGVPDRDEVDALREQIDTLGDKIERLQDAVSEAQREEEA